MCRNNKKETMSHHIDSFHQDVYFIPFRFPWSKIVFDFARLPMHWFAAKAFLKVMGYDELLKYDKVDIIGAIRNWLTEEIHDVNR